MEISRMFNRATFINECIIRHEHPDNGVGVHDELYRKNSISGVDRQIFAERKAHGFYIRKTLIIQPGRWGDILINLPIAKHFDEQNHLVYWLCPGKYHDVFRNIDYATPIENVGSLQFDDVIDLSFGFGGKPENWWRENKANFESFIAAKYYLAGVNMQLRWQLQWKRNEAREQALYDKVVGNKESYTLTHEDTHIGRFLYVEVDNKVPFVPVDDFNVFDWYKVIENADEIHCIDSALSNFIEVVPEFRLIDKKIYLSKREPNYYLRSIYRNNWTIL
jgi:hypothetical protein